jgi:hypothetical protein
MGPAGALREKEKTPGLFTRYAFSFAWLGSLAPHHLTSKYARSILMMESVLGCQVKMKSPIQLLQETLDMIKGGAGRTAVS